MAPNKNNLSDSTKKGFIESRTLVEFSTLISQVVAVFLLLIFAITLYKTKATEEHQTLISKQVLPLTYIQRDILVDLLEVRQLQEKLPTIEPAIAKEKINALAKDIIQDFKEIDEITIGHDGLIEVNTMLSYVRYHEIQPRLMKVLESQTRLKEIRSDLHVFKTATTERISLLNQQLKRLDQTLIELSQKPDALPLHTKHMLLIDKGHLDTGVLMVNNHVYALFDSHDFDVLNELLNVDLYNSIEAVKSRILHIEDLVEASTSKALKQQIRAVFQTNEDIFMQIYGINSIVSLLKRQISETETLQSRKAAIDETTAEIYNNLNYTNSEITNYTNTLVEKAAKLEFYINYLVLITFALIMLGIIVALQMMTKRIVLPVQLLTSTMEKLIAGDYKVRLPERKRVTKEFEQVWDEFNSFVEQTDNLMQEHKLIFENADIGIAWVKNRKYVRVNKKFLSIFNANPEDFINAPTSSIYKFEEDYLKVGQEGYKELSKGNTYTIEARTLKKDGREFDCRLTGRGTGIGTSGSIWLHEDITEQKKSEEHLFRLANYDTLTNLCNRALFNVHLEKAIKNAARQHGSFAVMFIDLDRFKHINDTLGHDAGDQVLVTVSERMNDLVREGDIVARLGGDEFVILIQNISAQNDLASIAQKILDSVSAPMAFKGQPMYAGCCIGISRYPQDGLTNSELLRCSDAAMYTVKNSGRNGFSFYNKVVSEASEKQALLSQSLKTALNNDEFTLHYQPKVDMVTKDIIGLEALLRWEHPTNGLIMPGEFIGVLEQTGLMGEVGDWIINETCNSIKTWKALGVMPGKVAINLSERQFKNKNLIQTLKTALADVEISPNDVELEITESLMMDDSSLTIELLNQIRALGIVIAIDDFGTGYSSLSYLKKFPIDILKIDRYFVQEIYENSDDAAIVDAIIVMAKRLNLKTVAEGIETVEQYEFLKEKGCEIGQGYLFGKPLPFDEMLALLTSKTKLEIAVN